MTIIAHQLDLRFPDVRVLLWWFHAAQPAVVPDGMVRGIPGQQTLVVFVIRRGTVQEPAQRALLMSVVAVAGWRRAAIHAARPCSGLPHYRCRCWVRLRCLA